MSAYYFFDVRHIHDQDALAEYRQQVFATVERFGGRYRVLGGPVDVLEGEWSPVIPVVIEFPDIGQAKKWYDSALYRPLKERRLQAADCCGILMPGFDHEPQAHAGS